jgi:hypothetical protein
MPRHNLAVSKVEIESIIITIRQNKHCFHYVCNKGTMHLNCLKIQNLWLFMGQQITIVELDDDG